MLFFKYRKINIDEFMEPLPEYDFIHLQWFAAEDEGRTEDPTEQKIRKAREEGKVAKSAELSSALVLIFCVVTLAFIAGHLVNTMKDMIVYYISQTGEIDVAQTNLISMSFFKYFVKLSTPIAVVAFIAAFFANLFQVGFKFSVKAIKPDLKKISPNFVRFFKRALFSKESIFNLGKSIFKIMVIGIISYINIRSKIGMISNMSMFPLMFCVLTISKLAFVIMAEASIAMLILAIPDYYFQKKQHKESLKMSKQEVKEERKMSEGDPLVKSRLKERMREILNNNMMQNVPKADVVITNPTHFAVVLEWDRETMEAPMVSAKGQDNIAFKIREIAKDNSVPIIENKPLARALYAELEIGDLIPEQYYEVLAIIFSQVFKLKGLEAEAV